MGQNREHRATRGALETPDGDPTQLDPDIMGVARLTRPRDRSPYASAESPGLR
jgi:hypothetical protein